MQNNLKLKTKPQIPKDPKLRSCRGLAQLIESSRLYQFVRSFSKPVHMSSYCTDFVTLIHSTSANPSEAAHRSELHVLLVHLYLGSDCINTFSTVLPYFLSPCFIYNLWNLLILHNSVLMVPIHSLDSEKNACIFSG
jgi:hypothetical protein